MADFMLIDVIMIDSTHHLNLGQRIDIDSDFFFIIQKCGGGVGNGNGNGNVGGVALFICYNL